MNIDSEAWRWFWTVLAGVLMVGEIFTAGFFLVPFGIGAAAAAVLAWLGVNAAVQWVVFLAVSVAALLAVRPIIRKQDEGEPDAVGANRYLRKRGIVLEDIDMRTATGMVRVDTEEWRAISEGESIPAGTEIVVSGITGSRLVVRPIDQT